VRDAEGGLGGRPGGTGGAPPGPGPLAGQGRRRLAGARREGGRRAVSAGTLAVPEGFHRLVRAVDRALGIDLAPYASAQLFRRLDSFCHRHGIADLAGLARRLEAEPALGEAFAAFLTINVTEFFRNPRQWAALRRLLPSLPLSPGGGVRAWSAGCSIGAEPYSLAMLLREALPGRRHQVLATDIDADALAQAEAGRYTAEQVTGVPDDLKSRYLRAEDGGFTVVEALRRMVRFQRHAPAPGRVERVLCPNLAIYFTGAGRDRASRCPSQSRVEGGLLLIGATESLPSPAPYGLSPVEPGFYRKVAA